MDYKKLVKIYDDAYKILKDGEFTSEILFWIHQSSEDIRRLNKILKGIKDLSLDVKNKLQATVWLTGNLRNCRREEPASMKAWMDRRTESGERI